ncbi:MAG TPA: hypothetical protein VH164_01165 [Ktedonobacteraceae bacterium]|jgi:hypothetical protein|nr:hypothetical protein [Ktedonobacteraceae bacterium]
MDPGELIIDSEDAKLKDMVDKWMAVTFPQPFEELKQLMLEHALQLRQLRKLAIYNYIEIDGVRYVKASELLLLME